MFAYAIGVAIPLTALGLASRRLKRRIAPAMIRFGSKGKNLFGAVLVVLGLLIATDLDRLIEAYLTQASPHWLVELTTRY